MSTGDADAREAGPAARGLRDLDVTCTVVKGDGDDAAVHRNFRVFSRPGRPAAWQLVGWVTEPVLPTP